jgi:hypothetical protein
MTPDSIHLSSMHQAFLEMTGASLDKESDGRFYVYWEESLCEDVGEFQMDEAIEAGNITSDEAGFIANSSFVMMLRHILQHEPNKDVTHIEVEGAWTCSKMRPGQFGGFSYLVTREEHGFISSSSMSFDKKTGKIVFNNDSCPFE